MNLIILISSIAPIVQRLGRVIMPGINRDLQSIIKGNRGPYGEIMC